MATTLNPLLIPGSVVQVVQSSYPTLSTFTVGIPVDDTIPQISEGTELLTASITPKSSTSLLDIHAVIPATQGSANSNIGIALFRDSTLSALSANSWANSGTGARGTVMSLRVQVVSGSTASTTFRIRIGPEVSGGTITVNGVSGARIFGGVQAATLTITEIAA